MNRQPLPFIDLRGKTPVDLLRAYPDRGRDLIQASRRTWGVWSQTASWFALPLADRLSKRWLMRRKNPYLHEIETLSELLGQRGSYALNLCFEWGCTSGVWQTGATAALLRVLDWPFPGLGKYVVVALQSGKAGNFYNVTWPGMSGVFNAMAPGRFSAAINQAPMRKHGLTYPGDWIKNRILFRKQTGLPPSHLLRQVFEAADTYEEAKEMLRATPLAIPAIFTLAGTKKGEGCIIERLEDAAEVIVLADQPSVACANHFISRLQHVGKGWRAREIDSMGRYRAAHTISAQELNQPHFGWLKGPIANANTRLIMLADAAEARLLAQGYEGMRPVTNLFALGMRREQMKEETAPHVQTDMFEVV